jgi:hypothetical protein
MKVFFEIRPQVLLKQARFFYNLGVYLGSRAVIFVNKSLFPGICGDLRLFDGKSSWRSKGEKSI